LFSVFGKTIEQKRNYQNVKLILTKRDLLKYVNKPTVQSIIPIDENCSIVLMKKLSVCMDKIVPAGAAILDRSKACMYNFYYNYLKKKFGNNVRLVYTDTDSFVLHIKTKDVYEDFFVDKEWFDMSEMHPKHPQFKKFYDNTNSKVLGKFKDEYSSLLITEFVAPRPKSYAMKVLSVESIKNEEGIIVDYVLDKEGKPVFEDGEKKKLKGVAESSVRQQLSFNNFMSVLEKPLYTSASMKTFVSKQHQLYTVETTKQALCGINTKRFCYDSINTLAFGHKDCHLH